VADPPRRKVAQGGSGWVSPRAWRSKASESWIDKVF
jgi:hypothetical protein